MRRVTAFGRFWWDFVVGDDWVTAACIVVAIAVTAAVATIAVPAWWLMPLAVAATLYLTVRRALRDS